MSASVIVLLVVLWMVVGFIGLRLAAIRYFNDPRQGAVAAAAVVVAFALGALLPFPHRTGDAGSGPAATAAASQAPARKTYDLGSGGIDLTARCAAVKRRPGQVDGHTDLLGAGHGTLVEDRGDLPSFTTNDEVVLAGWATSNRGSSLARGVCLIVDGKVSRDAAVRYGYPRPDIENMFHNASDRDAGFQLRVRASRLGAGKHHLRVAVIMPSGGFEQIPQALDVTVQ